MPRAVSQKRLERMHQILSLLQDREAVMLDELSALLQVSGATIRRDLAELEQQGLLVRTHGGAQALELPDEIPVRLRGSQFRRAKQLIAQQTARMIPPGPHTLAVSGGTTTTEVVRTLRYRADLTIITNSLHIAAESAPWPHVRVIITGGVVRSHSFEATGPLSEATFNSINVATAVLGADGVSAAGGITTHDEIEARASHAMVTHARRVIVVADSSKVGRVTLARMADIGEVHDLVTDAGADPDELERIRCTGVRLHIAEERERPATS
ncbi:DeoR/GlpR family DNA-binding transcription regulator [Rhodococcus marinonascens]|uniref:DeoR/GlpR family DNA-binding transcription regulator n=1 Tax=Rhodococcus marinonascens TaxID=38311 RepID=UPI00093247B3|nr:DeoR/GlpR family DNA-binding transcription regulator [Rhodococcus marinonascens]